MGPGRHALSIALLWLQVAGATAVDLSVTEQARLEAHATALQALGVAAAPRRPAQVAEVQAALRPDEALLSYTAGAVLVVTPGAVAEVPLAEGIEAAARTWDQGSALYDLAVRDALATLPPGVTRLTVVPDGAMASVPFAALAPQGGPALNHRYAVAMVPSATHLMALRALPLRQGDDQVLVVADPEPPAWEAPIAPLPFARAEASAVAARFGQRSSTRLGRGASEGALLYLSPEYSMLHVAARAVSDPGRAVVLLAADERGDGLLTAAEVVEHGLDRPVVVLANTDPGRDGPWPLARAWLEAGALAVIVPLQKTSDAEASAVVVELHHRFAAGADVATALADAQRVVIAGGGEAVGLVAIGDGAAVPFAGGVPSWPSAWLWWGTLGVLGVVLGVGVVAGRIARRGR